RSEPSFAVPQVARLPAASSAIPGVPATPFEAPPALQQRASPVEAVAQARPPPATRFLAPFARSCTGAGLLAPAPQQSTRPSSRVAQVCAAPRAISRTTGPRQGGERSQAEMVSAIHKFAQ